MSPEITNGIFTLGGAIIGGGIAFLVQWKAQKQQMEMLIEQIKTEHMAEITAMKYLDHVKFKRRSFKFLSTRLGGFEENELRKILVRAGAVRYFPDGIEWWQLLDEYRKNKIQDEEE